MLRACTRNIIGDVDTGVFVINVDTVLVSVVSCAIPLLGSNIQICRQIRNCCTVRLHNVVLR